MRLGRTRPYWVSQAPGHKRTGTAAASALNQLGPAGKDQENKLGHRVNSCEFWLAVQVAMSKGTWAIQAWYNRGLATLRKGAPLQSRMWKSILGSAQQASPSQWGGVGGRGQHRKDPGQVNRASEFQGLTGEEKPKPW